jgi:hypothetical protein
MFKSLRQLQDGVTGGYAEPSVNNIIDIKEEPMKGKGGYHVHILWFP